MRVLVTGAEGFIGSHLVELLVAKDHSVTAFCQYNSFNTAGWLDSLEGNTKKAISMVPGDVRDPDSIQQAVQGHDAVIHLAALIAIPYSYQAPKSYVDTNVLGTLNTIEAARRAGVSRFIHTSTSEVYGSAQYVPMDEHHPLVGQSPYSASKIGADQIAFSYWSSFQFPMVTVRPFNSYGPRQSQRAFIPSVMIQHLAGSGKLSLGSLTPTRDLTFVKDTVHGFLTVLESDGGLGETFNLGSGFEVSMQEIVSLVAEISGKRLPPTLDESRVRTTGSEVERLWSDSSKFESTFGWKPSKQGREGLRAGLEETYRWFQQNSRLSGYDADRYVL